MTKIEELENKMLEIAQEIAELKKGQNAGEWKPKIGEDYWYMDFNGETNVTTYQLYNDYDNWRIINMPVFKTKEECQKYCDYRNALIEKSYKFSREEWNDDEIDKYFIYYSYAIKAWIIENQQFRHALGVTHFKTFDDAQFMIDNYSDEMLKWGLL